MAKRPHGSGVLDNLHERIADRAASIAAMFSDSVKVTIIVRNQEHPDGSRDVLLTNDRLDDAIAAARRVEATGDKTPARDEASNG